MSSAEYILLNCYISLLLAAVYGRIKSYYSRFVDLSSTEDIVEGLQLVDDYARSFSADNENVDSDLILKVLRYIVSAFESNPGSILIFLPGYEEIFFLKSVLESDSVFEDTSRYRLFVLHSNVNTEDQRKVFDKCEQRKIILSTNVAETSLTIDDVSFVIDPGKTKEVGLFAFFYQASGAKPICTRTRTSK